jgi:hypothetical protein
MAFLDNSGDIILDAVLTDTGRLRLAQGDGSFKISKFALGDDEINYALYNKNHSSGSAYYDLEVLQTPILEAFTNNTSNLKTKLVSVSRTNILYMPTLKLNENDVTGNKTIQAGTSNTFQRDGNVNAFNPVSDSKFYVAVDQTTYDALKVGRTNDSGDNTLNPSTLTGLIEGFAGSINKNLIRVDQGLDTNEISPNLGLDSDLLETAYIVEMDYRLGRVKPVEIDSPAPVNFIDDDNIASYYLTDATYVNPKGAVSGVSTGGANPSKDINDLDSVSPVVHQGPRGSTLQLRIHASQELNSSTYLFTQIGQSKPVSTHGDALLGLETDDHLVGGGTIYYIDSTVRVVGANTGYRLDIPIRYVKLVY